MDDLITLIKKYQPVNEQETIDQQVMIDFISKNTDVLVRDNQVAHLTSSAIVVNEAMDKVLFAYHNIYDSWGWVGGHNDGDDCVLCVAIKEAKEETGVKHIRPYSEDIFMIDTIHVSNHYKKGAFVPDHLHMNITFLLIADESDELVIKPDENQGVKWFKLAEIFEVISEERMKPIYQKALDKLVTLKKYSKL